MISLDLIERLNSATSKLIFFFHNTPDWTHIRVKRCIYYIARFGQYACSPSPYSLGRFADPSFLS